MGALSESEIFGCLSTNFRLAAEDAEKLAVLHRKGPTYRRFRDELDLIEGACRQASVWRQDTRWLQIGLLMAAAHKNAGEWLRGIKVEGQPMRVPLAPGHKHPLFMRLAETLRACQILAENLRDKKTGRVGMILPKPKAAPIRTQGRPSQILLPAHLCQTKSGLILPPGTVRQ